MFKIQNKEQANPQVLSILNSAIHKEQQIVYLRSDNNKLISVCLNTNKQMIVRECSIDSVVEVSVKIDGFQKTDEQICFTFVEGGDAFIVYKNPFSIYYLNKQEQKPIKLVLQSQFCYKKTCIVALDYPNLTVYGAKQNQKKSTVTELNLQTLGSRIINDGKGYSPGIREGAMSVMMDGRIYVFGGTDQLGKQCEKMIWVYDMEKGYWFALEMDYPHQDYSSCHMVAVSHSRAMIFSQHVGKVWLFEIHQSRLTQVQGAIDLSGKIVCFEGELISYGRKGWRMLSKKQSFQIIIKLIIQFCFYFQKYTYKLKKIGNSINMSLQKQ